MSKCHGKNKTASFWKVLEIYLKIEIAARSHCLEIKKRNSKLSLEVPKNNNFTRFGLQIWILANFDRLENFVTDKIRKLLEIRSMELLDFMTRLENH